MASVARPKVDYDPEHNTAPRAVKHRTQSRAVVCGTSTRAATGRSPDRPPLTASNTTPTFSTTSRRPTAETTEPSHVTRRKENTDPAPPTTASNGHRPGLNAYSPTTNDHQTTLPKPTPTCSRNQAANNALNPQSNFPFHPVRSSVLSVSAAARSQRRHRRCVHVQRG